MRTQSDLDAEFAQAEDYRRRWQYELSEARKVHEQLLSIGQMQAVLLLLLKRQKGLKPADMGDIVFADRKMRALDLPLSQQLRDVVRKIYAEADVQLPDFEIAGSGSSLSLGE